MENSTQSCGETHGAGSEKVLIQTQELYQTKKNATKKETIAKLLHQLAVDSSDQFKVRTGVSKLQELLNINED